MKPYFFINGYQKFLKINLSEVDCINSENYLNVVDNNLSLNLNEINDISNDSKNKSLIVNKNKNIKNQVINDILNKETNDEFKTNDNIVSNFIIENYDDTYSDNAKNIKYCEMKQREQLENEYECVENKDKNTLENNNQTTFVFLSESNSGNKIILRFYDNYMKEYCQIFIYSYTMDRHPEKIEIPFLNVNKKTNIYYEIYDISLTEKYFSGKFILYPPNYQGYIDIGFICLSDKGIISNYKNNIQIDDKFHKFAKKFENFHFDVLYHCGNFSKIENLFNIYKKNSNILEIFSIFRQEILVYYSDETIGNSLRQCWNYNMLNELDVLNIDDEKNKYYINEFIYYMKIIYDRYLLFPNKNLNSKYNFNTSVILGNKNIISLDCQHSLYYEKKYFGKYIYEFLQKKLLVNKENVILLSIPLLTDYKMTCESESFLKFLFEYINSNNDLKINIISFHKNGDSYVHTHIQNKKGIIENVCSGINNDECSQNKIKLYLKIYLIQAYKKLIYIHKSKTQKIITKKFTYNGMNNNITVILNNFLLNTHI